MSETSQEDIEWLCKRAIDGSSKQHGEIYGISIIDEERINKIKSDLISKKKVREVINKLRRENEHLDIAPAYYCALLELEKELELKE